MALTAAGVTAGVNPAARQELLAPENYGDMPLTFEANHGQSDAGVDFIARTVAVVAPGAESDAFDDDLLISQLLAS